MHSSTIRSVHAAAFFSESGLFIINAVPAFVKESPLRGRGAKSAVRKLRTANFHMYSAAPFSGWKQYCIVASLWWRFTRWEITSMSTYTGKAATLIISADRTKRMIPSTVSGFRWSRSVVGAAGFQTDADQPERRCPQKRGSAFQAELYLSFEGTSSNTEKANL